MNTEIQNQNPIPTQSTSKPKLTVMAKRKASSPMKSPPPRKTAEFHFRHNARPIRARQPPSLLGERVFTSLVETSGDRPGEHFSTYVKTPLFNPSLEAITIETGSHQMDVAGLTSPLTSYLWHSILDNLTRRGPKLVGKTESSLRISPTLSLKKFQFKPEVRKSEFDPSGLPSGSAAVVETPIVNNPDWLNTARSLQLWSY